MLSLHLLLMLAFCRYYTEGQSTGDVKLVIEQIRGRLEVYHNDTWGTVCKDGFGDTDAGVACKELGFSSGISVKVPFGKGTIWLDDVSCRGNESRLDNCGHSKWGLHNCGHHEDVGIDCRVKQSANGGLNIWSNRTDFKNSCVKGLPERNNNYVVNGNDYCYSNETGANMNSTVCCVGYLRVVDGIISGRLDVYYNGEWRTVCRDTFNDKDAKVACTQLGFGFGSAQSIGQLSEGGIKKIRLSCFGNESRLIDCAHSRWSCEDVNITCSMKPIVHGGWNTWSGWRDESTNCGPVRQTRTRYCISPTASFYGNTCYGDQIENRLCSNLTVNGGWSMWSNWTDCTTRCGGGLKTRSRKCDNPITANGGNYCFGNAIEAQLCNTVPCAVSGGWSIWSSWTDCSPSCRGGLQTRIRKCNNPPNAYGGEYCYGNATEARPCNRTYCAVNGGWSIWSNWTECVVTCGGGLQTRIRHCNNPPTLYGGDYCYGNATEARLCNKMPCAVNGGWSIWSNWADCTTTCNGGLQIRIRYCNNPQTACGGYYCYGNATEARVCNTVPCADTTTTNVGLQRNQSERHDVSCKSDSMSVFIPSTLLSQNETLSWRDPHCTVTNNGTHYVSVVSHTACGTTVKLTDSEVIFENDLIIRQSASLPVSSHNDIVDFGGAYSEIIPVKCVYPRRQNVTTAYIPAQTRVRFFEKRYGHMDVELEQYHSDKFDTVIRDITYPREVPINQDMYIKLHTIHNSSDIAIKVDSCVATPSIMPADGQLYPLIDHGCPASPAVKLYPSAFNEVKFSVHAFEFKSSPGSVVYIHCQISVCLAKNPQCVVGCRSRQRREVSAADDSSHLVSGGPYLLVAEQGSVQMATIVAAVCACLAVVATIVAAVGWRRKLNVPKHDSKLISD